MPGNYKLIVTFPFVCEDARAARVQLEPFACVRCYGIIVKVIFELVGGNGDNRYIYERIAYEQAITQESISDGFMAEAFVEAMEAFYFCKIDRDVLIPVCALMLKK